MNIAQTNITLKAVCLYDIKDCENTLVAKAGEIVEIGNCGRFVVVKKNYAFGTGVLLTSKEASLLLQITESEKELSHA